MQISKDRIELAPIDVTMLERGDSRCTMAEAIEAALTEDIQSGFMRIRTMCIGWWKLTKIQPGKRVLAISNIRIKAGGLTFQRCLDVRSRSAIGNHSPSIRQIGSSLALYGYLSQLCHGNESPKLQSYEFGCLTNTNSCMFIFETQIHETGLLTLVNFNDLSMLRDPKAGHDTLVC